MWVNTSLSFSGRKGFCSSWEPGFLIKRFVEGKLWRCRVHWPSDITCPFSSWDSQKRGVVNWKEPTGIKHFCVSLLQAYGWSEGLWSRNKISLFWRRLLKYHVKFRLSVLFSCQPETWTNMSRIFKLHHCANKEHLTKRKVCLIQAAPVTC